VLDGDGVRDFDVETVAVFVLVADVEAVEVLERDGDCVPVFVCEGD